MVTENHEEILLRLSI